MKHESRSEDWLDIAEALLEDNYQLRINTRGFSMFPVIRPGDVCLVEKCTASQIIPGDVVVVRKGHNLIAHRLVRVLTTDKEYQYICRGDNNHFDDIPATANEVVGKVMLVSRSKKTYRTDGLKMKLERKLIMRFPQLILKRNKLQLRMKLLQSSIKSNMKTLKRNLQVVSEGAKREIRINGFLSVLMGILPFVVIVAVKLIVDLLTQNDGSLNNTLLYFYIGLTALIYLLNMFAAQLKTYFSEKLSFNVARNMYRKLHAKHISLALSHFENPKELDKLHRAVQEASYRPVKLIHEVQNGLRSIVSSLFLLGIFLTIKWYLVLILVIAVVPGVLVHLQFAGRFHRLKESQSASERRMYYFNRILTGFPFAKELRLYGFASFFLNQFGRLHDFLYTEKIALRRSELRWNMIAQVFSVLLIFFSLFLVTYLMVQGTISIGTVVLFFFAFQRGYSVLNDLFKSVSRVLEDNIFLNDFVDFLNLPDNQTNVKSIVKQQELSTNAFSLKQGIEVRDVHFAYETSKRNALNGVSLRVSSGETIALVGENGSGKTTLIKLLCGFYLPQSGDILYDGISTEQIGQEEICANISTVFQDFAFYNMPVIENLRLGDINNHYSRDDISKAIAMAGLEGTIEQLPQGYDTLLGNQFLGGEELSVGQWQKMAIARAFLRNSPLLLLDEPSSALDANSEAIIIDSLRRLTQHKTAIIVSHRLRTVQWVDRIFFMHNGRVTEHGTHSELMQLRGSYYEMYNRMEM